MDTAVALVEAYLRVNGYFTIAEYPVVEELRGERHRTLTDIDILAFRFPAAGSRQTGSGRRTVDPEWHDPDAQLSASAEVADMIIGEVKEGTGRLNPGSRDPIVLRATLIRFGCCGIEEADHVVNALLQQGRATTKAGHRIRMMVFGSTRDEAGSRGFDFIPLGHLVNYLNDHIAEHWQRLRHSQIKDPALAFMLTLEKAKRGTSGAGNR